MSPEAAGGPGEIRIDKEGAWFFNGVPIVNKNVLALFNAGIEPDGGNGYRLRIGAEVSPIVVEDTPYVVRRIERGQGPDGRGFFMQLSDGSSERLRLETLYVSGENVPYCRVKNGRFPARFLRPPYYQLAEHIEQEDDRFFIREGDKKVYLEIR